MDPESIFKLAASSAKDLYEFYTLWKDCPKDVKDIRSSLEWLTTIFTKLGDALQKPNLERGIRDTIETAQTNCETRITELKDILNKVIQEDPQPGFFQRLKAEGRRASYPFRKSTITRLEEIIDDLKDDLILAINLLSLNTLATEFEIISSKLDLIIEDDERARILAWLLAQSSIHELALEKYEPETGDWFLGNPFKIWKESHSSFLWLHGDAGCGKTVLCSSIIEKVKLANGVNDHLAYFYFSSSSSRDQHRDQHRDFLTSAISQLFPKHGASKTLRELYEKQNRKGGDLEATFISLVKELSQETPDDHDSITNPGGTFIIIDALNLIPSGDQRNSVLNLLKKISALSVQNLHVLATSRRESDIETALKADQWQSFFITDDQTKADIQLYVANHIAKNEYLNAQKENIELRLIEGAKGLGAFQRAALQIQYLETLQLQVMRPMDFDKVFNEELPRILNARYEAILAKIDTHFKQEVLTALQWLAFSDGPLYVEEVAEACIVSQQGDTPVEEKRRFPHPSAIVDILSGLVTVFPPLPPPNARKELPKNIYTLELAHSVKEYLVGDQICASNAERYSMKDKSPHCFIAESCLNYISYYSAQRPNGDSMTPIPDEHRDEFPLLQYACEFWFIHAKEIPVESVESIAHVANFLESTPALLSWVRYYVSSSTEYYELPFDIDVIQPPLYYASHFGFEGVVKLLLHRHSDAGVWVALGAAAANGHLAIVKLLLEYKSDVDTWAALGTAARKGHLAIVELLLNHKANIDANDKDSWTTMRDIALKLNDKGQTALQVAGEKGGMSIILLLLKALLPPQLRDGWENETESCDICLDMTDQNFQYLLCKHYFHEECFSSMSGRSIPRCPVCTLPILRDPKA